MNDQQIPSEIHLQLSHDEARLIVGVLREISFGVSTFEYQAKLGFNQEKVKSLTKSTTSKIIESGIEL